MDEAYLDVDAYLAETDPARKAPVVKLFGQKWELPKDAPAAAILRAQRAAIAASKARDRLAKLGPDDDVPADLLDLIEFDAERHARDLLGDENVDAWLARDIGHSTLRRIVAWASRYYQGIKDGEGEGNPQAPGNGASGSTES